MKDAVFCLVILALMLVGIVFLITFNINELIKHLRENDILEITNDILFVGFLLIAATGTSFAMFDLPQKLLI